MTYRKLFHILIITSTLVITGLWGISFVENRVLVIPAGPRYQLRTELEQSTFYLELVRDDGSHKTFSLESSIDAPDFQEKI